MEIVSLKLRNNWPVTRFDFKWGPPGRSRTDGRRGRTLRHHDSNQSQNEDFPQGCLVHRLFLHDGIFDDRFAPARQSSSQIRCRSVPLVYRPYDLRQAKSLMPLGCGFPVWLARFLLRAAKGEQFFAHGGRGLIADQRESRKAIEESAAFPPEYPFTQPILQDYTPLDSPGIPREFRERHVRKRRKKDSAQSYVKLSPKLVGRRTCRSRLRSCALRNYFGR